MADGSQEFPAGCSPKLSFLDLVKNRFGRSLSEILKNDLEKVHIGEGLKSDWTRTNIHKDAACENRLHELVAGYPSHV
jgi:hypothetical protein